MSILKNCKIINKSVLLVLTKIAEFVLQQIPPNVCVYKIMILSNTINKIFFKN